MTKEKTAALSVEPESVDRQGGLFAAPPQAGQAVQGETLRELAAAEGIHLKDIDGEQSVCCPFHDDSSPSMSINLGTGLFHCHAGCGGGSAVTWLLLKGVPLRDAMRRVYGDTGSAGREQTIRWEGPRGARIQRRTDYDPPTRDRKTGKPVSKKIWWDKPQAAGAKPPGPQRLVHFPDRLPGPDERPPLIVWCEGAKAAAAVARAGFRAAAFVAADQVPNAETLAWAHAKTGRLPKWIIWPDNDGNGRKAAEQLAARAAKLSGTPEVLRASAPDRKPKDDAADCSPAEIRASIENATAASAAAAAPASGQRSPWREPALETARPVPDTHKAIADELAREDQLGAEIRFNETDAQFYRFRRDPESRDGRNWERGQSASVFDSIGQYCDAVARHLETAENANGRVRALRSAPFYRGTSEILAKRRGIHVPAADGGAEPYFNGSSTHLLLPTPAGIVDLNKVREWRAAGRDLPAALEAAPELLRPGRPDDRIVGCFAVAPDFGAKMPETDAYLNFGCSQGRQLDAAEAVLVKGWLFKYLGYCLTGSTEEQSMLMLLGDRDSGKSTLLDLLPAIMGKALAIPVRKDLILRRRGQQEPHEEIRWTTRHARLGFIDEASTGLLQEDDFKKIVSGGLASTRGMKRDSEIVVHQAKYITAGNRLPSIGQGGLKPEIAKRIHVLKFGAQVASPDRELPAKMRAESPAILAELIRGAVRWMYTDCTLEQDRPDSMNAALDEYREDSDGLAEFLREAFIDDDEGRLTLTEVHTAWKDWNAARPVKAQAPTIKRAHLRDLLRARTDIDFREERGGGASHRPNYRLLGKRIVARGSAWLAPRREAGERTFRSGATEGAIEEILQ